MSLISATLDVLSPKRKIKLMESRGKSNSTISVALEDSWMQNQNIRMKALVRVLYKISECVCVCERGDSLPVDPQGLD